MSCDVEVYVGYTVNLKEDLSGDDFDFFQKLTSTHKEYCQFNHSSESKVKLIKDGMNGLYARLIYIDKHLDSSDFYSANNYFSVNKSFVGYEEVYEELNKAYRLMYGRDLDKSQIEYAVWFHAS